MSNKSNDQGRAYEYITLMTLYAEISKVRDVQIIKNSSLLAAQSAWDKMDDSIKALLSLSAQSFIPTIFELEPLILEEEGDVVELLIQKDE